jgi:hypothetical protein
MEHTFNNLTEDELLDLDPEQLQQQIEKMGQVTQVINKMSRTIVGKKLMEIVYGYRLDSVGIDPHYEYNDEGFAGHFMINIDGEDVCMSGQSDENVPRYSTQVKQITYGELQQNIDDELSGIANLINEYMSFDLNDLDKLKVKSSYYKLEKELPKNTLNTKISNSRYKL